MTKVRRWYQNEKETLPHKPVCLKQKGENEPKAKDFYNEKHKTEKNETKASYF